MSDISPNSRPSSKPESMLVRTRKEGRTLTPKKEGVIREPDIIKDPSPGPGILLLRWNESNLDERVRVTGDHTNRTAVLGDRWYGFIRLISPQVFREFVTGIEVGVLRESNTLRRFGMAEIPKNLLRHRIVGIGVIRIDVEHLWQSDQA